MLQIIQCHFHCTPLWSRQPFLGDRHAVLTMLSVRRSLALLAGHGVHATVARIDSEQTLSSMLYTIAISKACHSRCPGPFLTILALCVQFGAACGLLVGHGVRAMVACINPNEAVSLPLYAICGAAAFLSGCVRYKATAILIAVESTGAWYLIVPVAISGETAANHVFT